jgi:serine/threonine-protein kinase HipA
MARRFDRLAGGEKLHMQSLCALAHFDFNHAGAYSYEQAFLNIRQLNLPMEAVEEQFRRMAFNIIARNQDDHVKNIAFLMDKAGRWSLAPAFDVTYSYNPAGEWTARHQMTMNGKRDGFTPADFRACAQNALMKRGRAEAIVEEVRAAVAKWPAYAEQAQVMKEWRQQIQRNLRLDLARA